MVSSRYITDILETMGMQKCSGAPTPITTVRGGNPEADGHLLEAEEHRIIRRVVGIDRFLRTLRRDIGFAVKELSPRLAAPRVRDFERCKRLCRYLKRTRSLGVFFPRRRGEDPDGFSLVAFSDSDWAPAQKTLMVASLDGAENALLESGSGLTSCPINYANDIPLLP